MWVGAPSMEATGAPYTAEILDIHASPRCASLRFKEKTGFFGGHQFRQLLPSAQDRRGVEDHHQDLRIALNDTGEDHMSELTPLTRDLSVFDRLGARQAPGGREVPVGRA